MTQNEIKESRALRNKEYYKTAIRQLSKNTLFFPTGSLYLFSCILNNSSDIQRSFQSDEIIANQNHSKFQTICKFDDVAFSPEVSKFIFIYVFITIFFFCVKISDKCIE